MHNKKDPIFIKSNKNTHPPKNNINKKINPPPKNDSQKLSYSKKLISRKLRKKSSKKKNLDKKHTKSRKISFRCYPQNNKNIKDVIQKANKMTNNELKKELLNNGIEIKGNKQKLLKDIYMFSSMGGIKIHRE